ncbi:MAG: 3'-5' exonuclease domain-containing protein 2 [Bacteroidetes bacterium]|nr:MAG: 3'-5' exonuclease domain-containing protein 2 [Bacteroidota bacterium]RLD84795.1 MAG: 3'-5' exonuclease domain-containing protein 2 [Bacteroidota bacterium]
MMQFAESISKDDMNKLPLRAFEGEIYIVESDYDAQKAISILKKTDIIGFDTETRPSFKKGRINKVALLQLSSSSQAFLFRLNGNGLHKVVADLLADEKIVKVGVAIRDDLIALKRIKKFEPQSFLELQTYVKNFDIQNFSLQKLAAIVLGFRISKSKRLSNWEAETLDPGQKRYAATDAWVSLEVYKKLLNNI